MGPPQKNLEKISTLGCKGPQIVIGSLPVGKPDGNHQKEIQPWTICAVINVEQNSL